MPNGNIKHTSVMKWYNVGVIAFPGFYSSSELLQNTHSKADSQAEDFRDWNMTDSTNWRVFWLDHREKFSHSHLTINEKTSITKSSYRIMDQLLLNINAWGLTHQPQFHVIKAHQHTAHKCNFRKQDTCELCVYMWTNKITQQIHHI